MLLTAEPILQSLFWILLSVVGWLVCLFVAVLGSSPELVPAKQVL